MGSGLSESSIKAKEKPRQSYLIREISEDEEELSLISREGGGEIIKAITQTESSHLSMSERVRRLEREIQFKDEIIAKYEDLFGGGAGERDKENYNLMNQRYKNIIGELRERLKERNAQVNELELQLERRGIDSRYEKNWKLEQEHEELKVKYRQRQKVVEDLEGRLEAVTGEIGERCMRVEEREEKETFIKVEKVRRELEALREENKEVESSRMALIERVSGLEYDLREAQKERDQLKQQFSRLLEQSQRQISELEVASNELGVYREKNELKQSNKIKELASNNQSLLKELKEVKTELKEKIEELDEQKQELEVVTQQKEEAEEELQFVKSQQSAEINLIDRKCDSVQEVNMKLMEENGALRQKEIDYRRQMRRLEKARENYKEQYLDLKRELKELKLENQHLKREKVQERHIYEPRVEQEEEVLKQHDSKSQMVTDIKDLIAQYKLEKQTKRVINF